MTGTTDVPAAGTSTKRRAMLALQIAGTAAAFALLVAYTDLAAAFRAMRAVDPLAAILSVVLIGVGLLLGAARWRSLFVAYGAAHPPSVLRLFHLYLVGMFYNTCVPGGLGGDVVRGATSRDAFGEHGTAPAFAVVLVDRALGVVALLLLSAASLALSPVDGMPSPFLALGIAITIAIGTITFFALARRIGGKLPGKIGAIASKMPSIAAPPAFALALGFSLLVQLAGVGAGYMVLHAIDPRIGIAQALFIIPLAGAAGFFPLSIGGAGAREAAFVGLASEILGMARDSALAASLSFFAVQIVVALIGGLTQLVKPLGRTQA